MRRAGGGRGVRALGEFTEVVPEEPTQERSTSSSIKARPGRRQSNGSQSAREARGGARTPDSGSGRVSTAVPPARARDVSGDGRRYRSDAQSAGHPDGPYGRGNETFGRYQNVAGCAHMLTKLVRMTSGDTHSVDWQLNLRGGIGRAPEDGWRRYFQRPQSSFDATKEICDPNDEAFQRLPATPCDKRVDRHRGGIKIASIREEPIHTLREVGCEGTDAGQWLHLLKEKPAAAKDRHRLIFETTLRTTPGDPSGAAVMDNRSNGCVVEMLGKKSWHDSRSIQPLAWHPQVGGDVKLHHLSFLKPELEPDEENRAVRVSRTPRRDLPSAYANNMSFARPMGPAASTGAGSVSEGSP